MAVAHRHSASQPFTITVNAVNDAPTFHGCGPERGRRCGRAKRAIFAINFQPGPVTATDEARKHWSATP